MSSHMLAQRGSKSGWLQRKKRAGLLGGSSWKNGYWVLSGSSKTFREYSSEEASMSTTSKSSTNFVSEIDPRLITSVTKEQDGVALVLILKDSTKVHFKCQTEEDQDDWHAAIEEFMSDLSKNDNGGGGGPSIRETLESTSSAGQLMIERDAASSASVAASPRLKHVSSSPANSPLSKTASLRSPLKVGSFRFPSSPLSPAASTSSPGTAKKSFRLEASATDSPNMGSPKKSFFEKDMIDTQLFMNKARSLANSINRDTAESNRLKVGLEATSPTAAGGGSMDKPKSNRALILPSQIPEEQIDPSRFIKTKDQQEMLLQVVTNELCNVSNVILIDSPQSVLDCMYSLQVSNNQKLIEQGEPVEKMFVLETGKVGVFSQDFINRPMELETTKDKKGDSFGVHSIVYNQPGIFTCKTLADSTMWVLPRQKLHELTTKEARKRLAQRMNLLERIPLLAENLDNSMIDQLADSMQFEEYKQNSVIVRKGDTLHRVVVIQEGHAEMIRPTGERIRFRKGDIYGEWALLEGKKASVASLTVEADLIVKSPNLTALSLTVDEMENVIGPLKAFVLKKWREKNSLRDVSGGGADRSDRSLHIQYSGRNLEVTLPPVTPSPQQQQAIPLGGSGGGSGLFMVDPIQMLAEQELDKEDEEIIRQVTLAVKSRETTVRRGKTPTMASTVSAASSTGGENATLNSTSVLPPLSSLRGESTRKLGTIASQHEKSPEESEETTTDESENEDDYERRLVEDGDENLDKSFDKFTPLRPDLSLDTLKLTALLGKGNFGTVHLAEKDTEKYALKVISGEFIVSHGWEYSIENERDAMGEISQLSSPFLSKMFNFFSDSRNIYFVLELCEGGSLLQLLTQTSSRRISEQVAQFYMGCVIMSIEHLQYREICYRDLKPENVMITNTGYCKLIDFGLAKKTLRTFTVCGTPDYTAPEVLHRIGHGMAVDWWACGILLYELLCGTTPFCGFEAMDVYENILAHEKPEDIVYPDTVKVSHIAKDLIAEFLQPQKNKRLGVRFPGVRGIKAHAFFDKFDWDALEKTKMTPPIQPQHAVVMEASNSYKPDLTSTAEDKSGWTKKFAIPKA